MIGMSDMRKFAAIFFPVLLLLALAFPASATENPGYKIEVLRAEIEGLDVTECIVITSVSQAMDQSTDISQEARDRLMEVHADFPVENMNLPADGDYRYLGFADVSFAEKACVLAGDSAEDEEHKLKHQLLREPAAKLKVTFKLEALPEGELLAMAYLDEKWEALDHFADRGNGEIVCEFEDVCIVAFIDYEKRYTESEAPVEVVEVEQGSYFTENKNFAPSITYKDGLEITQVDTNILGSDGNSLGSGVGQCLIVTSIAQAVEKITDISQSERDLLLSVYNALASGEMELPIKGDYVIRDLIDVSFRYHDCRNLPDHGDKEEKLSEDGVILTLTFDMDLPVEAAARVLVYADDAWLELDDTRNNGDGTVTAVFEDIGPVAFVVDEVGKEDAAHTDDPNQDVWKWMAMTAVCTVGIAALLLLKRKKVL